jgi:hypothetical protein
MAAMGGVAAAWIGAVLFAAFAWTLQPLSYVQRYPLMLEPPPEDFPMSSPGLG